MGEMRIQADSSVPMYRQLETLLRGCIESGEIGMGERLPSEAQLGVMFRVSRITSRQALAELERDGLVERVPGKGTFVRQRSGRSEPLSRLSGFKENMTALGLTASYRTDRAEETLVSSEIASWLGGAGRRVFVIERVLMANDQPVGAHTSYLPLWLVEQAPPGTFSREVLNQSSLYQIIEGTGVSLQRAEEIVEPGIAEPEEAERLDMNEGNLVLRVRRTVYDGDGRMIEYVIITYRPDSYTFRVELRRDRKQ
jgi:GntR family transcriptional regulator